jgi:dipeptidyl-peptidase-3
VFPGDNIVLKRYEPSVEGLITSWMERFPSSDIDALLEEAWQKDSAYFK